MKVEQCFWIQWWLTSNVVSEQDMYVMLKKEEILEGIKGI